MESPLPPREALQEHAAFVHALAGRLVADPQTADDLAQETWLALLEHPPRHPSKIRGWLATTLRRFAGRVERGKRRRAFREREVARPEGLASAADEVAHEDLIETVAGSVLELGEPFRRTVIRRYYLGLTAAEIARLEGIPSGTVRSRLKRALDELRGRLDRRFGDRQTWSLALLELGRRWKPIAAGSGGAALTGGLVTATGLKLASIVAVAGALFLLRPTWTGGAELDPGSGRSALEITAAAAASAPAPVDATETRTTAALSVDAADAHRTEVTAADAALAVFRILEWDGRPNGDLLCLLMDERGGRQSMRSDERGLVAFEPTGETSTLVVARRAAPPHRVAVSLTPGEQELRLPRGAELSGRVLVGGLPPARSLRLVAYQAASRNVPATWNEADLERLLQSGHAPAETWTAADGSFCFVGLTPDWRGNLRLPRGYVEAGTLLTLSPYERREYFYPEPTTGILLELERFPSLAGRLLDPSGAPAVGGFAEANVTWTNGTGMFNGAQCDAQGRFEIFVDDEVRAVTLRCWQGPGRRGEVEYVFGPGELPADGELGDLTLGASRTVELRVVDAEGQPIVGAHTTLDSEPTDATGVTLLTGVGESTESFDVAARGFLGARVVLPAEASELTARLVRTNELSITIVGLDGEPLAGKSLELHSTRPLFVLRDLGFVARPGSQAQALHEGTWGFSASRAGDVRAAATTDDQGRLSTGGLRTDEPFVLRVRSAGGRLLSESEQEPLGAEEQRAVVLRVSERLYTFRGTVFDEQSRPLPDASVALSTELETEVGSSRRSDADGRFTIRWIAAPRGDLTISRDGYLPLMLTDLDFSDAADEARYTLRRGHVVTARVIDAAGLELSLGSVRAETADGTPGSWVGKPVGAARYELAGLPDQPIVVHLRLASADYREVHDPREPELTFVVPVHGAVEMVWDGADDAAWRDWISVRLVPLSDERVELSHEAIETPLGSHVFPLVLPGEYEAFVLRDGEVDEELTPRVRVRVEPGQTARVQLP